ncbi:MAG: (deoxy)nucleoside triphosphate pyrophosphohydrolase [Pseudomonadota bacterium]
MGECVIVCAAGLIDRDGRVLMTTRPEGKDYAGFWEFPGGKVEQGEAAESALVRELREEIGIDTEENCLAPFSFGTGSEGSLLLLLFLCRKWSGVAQGLEGQSLKWVEPSELLDLDMPPIDRPLAAQLRDFLGGF